MKDHESLIRSAIEQNRLIAFRAGGHERLAEPHVLGKKDGAVHCLMYQIEGGSSSGGLPQWRRFNVAEITQLIVTSRPFEGPRPNPSGNHSPFDVTIVVVKKREN